MPRTTRKKHLLAGLAAAGVLGVGLAAPTVAFAADGDTPTPGASTGAEDGDRQQQRADRQAEFAGKLAAELGVDADKVTAALEKLREEHKPADRPERGDRPGKGDPADRQAAMKERLAEAVEDGRLTQEQADAVTAAAEAGVLPGRGGHGAPAGR
ncbi:hypothetical protein ACFHW0_01800 [Micromonospora sp. LOL_025]|uniref:hypothetical protein n=1 Tax=Micromonospora sp. LOL_025 TaxID=3345413 RepID=UPI003A8900C1